MLLLSRKKSIFYISYIKNGILKKKFFVIPVLLLLSNYFNLLKKLNIDCHLKYNISVNNQQQHNVIILHLII